MPKIIRLIAKWMNKHYPFIMKEVVVGHDHYVARKPPKGRKKVKRG